MQAGPGARDRLSVDTTETTFNKDQSSLTALNVRGLVDLDSFYTLAISAAVVAMFVFGLMLQRRREYVVLRAQGCPRPVEPADRSARPPSWPPAACSPAPLSGRRSACCSYAC